MALKVAKIEVSHRIVANTVEELDKVLADWLNDGWKALDFKILSFERVNRILEVAYILVKTPKE